MRRFVRFGLYVCLVLLLVAGAFLTWLYVAPIPSYPAERVDLKVERSPEQIAEGRRLATMMCVGCHRNKRTGTLSGAPIDDVPAKFGRFYSANITRDPDRGIGRYTDGELAFLLRTGIRRDRRLAVVMPAFPGLADVELRALIAFVTSDDPLVRATPVASTPPDPSLFGKALAHFVFGPHAYPSAPIALPAAGDKVALGQYLALRRMKCFECHSADFAKQDAERPERSAGFFGGNNSLLDANGEEITSANLTMDAETGIGRWSEADFVRALRTGIRPDTRMLRAPMSPYPAMTPDEASAIFAYLKTVPVLSNPRRVSPAMQRATLRVSGGKDTFQKYCIGCHGQDGKSPYDLTHAVERYPTDDQLKAWIRRPTAFKPDTIMPAWDGIVGEQEYDGLVAHVRALAAASTR